MSFLSMYRGDDRVITITASESLDGCDVWFTAKRRRSDADDDAVIQKTSPTDITIDGVTAQVAIDAADTAELDHGTALFWDVQVFDTDGNLHTVASGRLSIVGDITRATS